MHRRVAGGAALQRAAADRGPAGLQEDRYGARTGPRRAHHELALGRELLQVELAERASEQAGVAPDRGRIEERGRGRRQRHGPAGDGGARIGVPVGVGGPHGEAVPSERQLRDAVRRAARGPAAAVERALEVRAGLAGAERHALRSGGDRVRRLRLKGRVGRRRVERAGLEGVVRGLVGVVLVDEAEVVVPGLGHVRLRGGVVPHVLDHAAHVQLLVTGHELRQQRVDVRRLAGEVRA